MQGILYEEAALGQFLFISCLLGGGAAWMTGRACALTWRPYFIAALYMLPLGGVVRYIHYVIFEATLTSLHYYLVDTGVLLLFCSIGFRIAQTRLMVRQYSWLYKKTSPFTWSKKNSKPSALNRDF